MTIEHEISERYFHLPSSNFAKIMKMAAEGKDIISLGPGEPDFITPEHIRESAMKAIDKGYTHYSPPGGRTETKQAIAKKLKKDNKINVSPDEIVVTCGSQEALFLATLSLLDPGEKMIVPDPGFLAFISMVETVTGVPVSIPLIEENGFEFDPDELEKLIDRRTKVILINSPSNPTGRILKKKNLERLADIAIQHDLVIFSDEAYEKLTYDNKKHISIASLNGMKERVLTFQSFSKTYAMAGFRVGYVAGPKDLIQVMTRLHIYTTVSAPTVSQIAAVEALTSDQSCVQEMRREYDRRRKLITKRLEEIPRISCLKKKKIDY